MMEYQKMINLLDNTPNQPSKFRTKNWVELTDELRNIIKSCAQFTNCIREINNTQIDNAKDIDIVMSMYNLIESSDDYSKTSGSLWHYYRDEPYLNANGAIADFPADSNNSALFKFKKQQAEQEMMVQKMLRLGYH